MKINVYVCSILLLSAVMLRGAPAEKGNGKPVTIDGHYTMMPQATSEPALLAQDLGSLVITPLKFADLNVTGKIESIELTVLGDVLRVVAIDSAGARVLSESVPVVHEVDGKKGFLTLLREWKSGDEWGSSKGTTTTKFMREADGNLLVAVSVVSSGRTFIIPRGESKSDSWLKYSPVASPNPPVPPSTPSKKKDEAGANGLFGRDRADGVSPR